MCTFMAASADVTGMEGAKDCRGGVEEERM